MLTALATGKESWALGCLGCVRVRLGLRDIGRRRGGKEQSPSDLWI